MLAFAVKNVATNGEFIVLDALQLGLALVAFATKKGPSLNPEIMAISSLAFAGLRQN